ncbi:MAG: D-glycero-beta-D-manno-heptose-7-phosphate kinase [Deltaproteobacteria bacterium]|nr:MAG: D-glycero-beta-D-manno-heptose-7-phosphate kinase [Deltaproteobacteria bacterium]
MEIDASKFEDCKLLVIGDLMIDEYLWGKVDRISPEAPVQIVSVTHEEYTLGGSGNVVNNLVALGAKVTAAGVVGTGTNGKLVLEKLQALGVDTRGIIQDSERPTTRKTRVIADHQHVLRIDRETKSQISNQVLKTLTQLTAKIIPQVDVVIVSDYGKGLVTKSLLTKLITTTKKHGKIIIADPKGLDFTKYAGVNVLTPNKKEAGLSEGIDIIDEATLLQVGTGILEKTGIDKVLITLGKDGMSLIEKNKPPYKIKAEARQVYDVSGAGDTVIAVLGLGLASGLPAEEAVVLANTAASLVVGKVGTATITQTELKTALNPGFETSTLKYVELDEVENLANNMKKKGKRIVLTNGCFDLLHAGHIMFFTAAKQLGDVLLVAIDDDASVRSLKGPGRPVIKAKERIKIISALDVVDYVMVFATDQLKDLIQALRPDVLTKGSNYKTEEVYGQEIVEKLGGRVVLIPVNDDISATRIISNIKNNDIT